MIAMVNTLDEQQRWARWVERRLPSASHKKYHHAAALKRLEPGHMAHPLWVPLA